jgi:hypothetical protein
MSYADWRDWARGEEDECPNDHQDTWRRVAENADCDARYEDPKVQPDAYQSDLGDEHPTTSEHFKEVCKEHQLTGMPVKGPVPDYLARCVKVQSVKTQVTERLANEERAGRDFGRTSSEEHDVPLPEIGTETWSGANEILPDPLDDLYLSAPAKNRVFATPILEDTEEAGGHSGDFLEHLDNVQRHGWSLAKEAVYRLALKTLPYPRCEYLLLDYDSSVFDNFRYPVPPDAEFWSLFRPIERSNAFPYGKTCPGGPPDCDEERAEPELVHRNPPISGEYIRMRSLGPTNAS